MDERSRCVRVGRLAALGLIVLTASALCRAAEDALLLVKSEPSGAGVFIDDDTEPRGTTPCVVLVAPGPHRVRLELGELRASAEPVAVAGAPVTVELKLTAPTASPQRTQRTQRESSSETSVSSVAKVLAEFDSLVDEGDYAGARRHMERARGKDAEIVRAAIRVADALAARRKAITAAAAALTWKDAELKTAKGILAGEVADVTDEGVVLVVKKKLRGGGTMETRARVRWSDLAPEQGDALARTGGWLPEGADGRMAEVYLALGRKDASAAQRSLAAARGHPLAAHLSRKIDAPKREAAGRAAWAAIEGKVGAKALSALQAKSLLERIAAFEREYADTDFAATVGKKLAAVKARAEADLEAGALLLGLVGWWKFDELRGNLARDSSGRGNHGAVEGGARRVRGRLGRALELDGRDDYVEVGGVGVSGAAPRTVSGWVRATGANIPHWAAVFGFSPAAGKRNSYFDIESRDGGNYVLHVSGADYAICAVDLSWHHLAATYDGITIARYLDGSLIGTSTRTLNTRDEVRMGKRASNSRHFPGLIDDVRVYDRALTATEIRALAAPD